MGWVWDVCGQSEVEASLEGAVANMEASVANTQAQFQHENASLQNQVPPTAPV